MQDWELALTAHKKFMKLTPENRGLFFALLGKEKDLDSYATSPVYYALTGRKGLWLYQDGNSYMPLCWHPNVDGEILVFPSRGANNPHILNRLLAEVPIPPLGLRLARVKGRAASSLVMPNTATATDRSISFMPVQENVLDWLFPVRILSTEKVAKLQGGEFYRIRNYISQMKRQNVKVERLSADHVSQFMHLVYRWANKRTTSANELIELVAPYKRTIELLDDDVFNLDGLVFFVDGVMEGAAMWEPPNTKTGIANAWVNLVNTEHKGICEFVMNSVSQTLFAEGIPFINYGGSETKGLDNFKEKYGPAHSVQLHSIEAIIEGNDLILDSLIKFRDMRVAA